MVVLNEAGNSKNVARFLRHYTHNSYPAFERALRVFTAWVMSRDPHGAAQVLALHEPDTSETVEPATAQVAGNALDILGEATLAKHQQGPVQPGSGPATTLDSTWGNKTS